jgi:murein L,D-transpeptidase YcbB/YkuD
VDWSSVTKNNFNYYIRQQGGGANALGLVKFIFPNKHSIYLHDTPTKYHFDLETRAYSHGCIRVHKAMDLAKFLLEDDENKYTIDSVYKYIDKKKEKHMSLNKKLPIFLYYFTAEADSAGSVKFYDDVYGLDKKLIKELINTGN